MNLTPKHLPRSFSRDSEKARISPWLTRLQSLQFGQFAALLGKPADLSIARFGHRANIARSPHTFLCRGVNSVSKGAIDQRYRMPLAYLNRALE